MTKEIGFTNIIITYDWLPADVENFLVKEWNRWQSGYWYNTQQFWDDLDEYGVAWAAEVDRTNPSRRWGTGDMSHDRRCWSFLQERYGEDLRVMDITDFVRGRTWLNQMRQLNALDEVKELMKARVDHRNKNYNHQLFIKIGYSVECTLRNVSGGFMIAERRRIITLAIHKFAMPLVNEVADHQSTQLALCTHHRSKAMIWIVGYLFRCPSPSRSHQGVEFAEVENRISSEAKCGPHRQCSECWQEEEAESAGAIRCCECGHKHRRAGEGPRGRTDPHDCGSVEMH